MTIEITSPEVEALIQQRRMGEKEVIRFRNQISSSPL